MAENKAVPPVPYKTPVVTSSGFINPTWSKFLEFLYIRIGGPIALTNEQLEQIQSQNLEEIEADIDDLQVDYGNLETLVTANSTSINDILQGPNL